MAKGRWWLAALLVPMLGMGTEAGAGESEYYGLTEESAETYVGGETNGVDYVTGGDCGAGCGCWGGAGWFFGAEATFFNPNFSGNNVRACFEDIPGATVTNYYAGAAGLNGLYVGPRLTFGWQGDCWGLVGRYWQLDASSIAYDPLTDFGNGFALPGVMAEERFNAYTMDIEAVRPYTFYDTPMQFSFGARHASLDQDSVLMATDLVNGDQLTGFGVAFRDFHGTGLTMGWGGWLPICGSPTASMFWNLRSSVLWGNIKNSVETQAVVVSGANSTYDTDGYQSDVQNDLWIGEAQLGCQWNHRLQCVPACAFLRAAGEYQYWDATCDSANSNAIVLMPGNSQISMDANAQSLRLGLIGFSLGAGFAW